MPTEKVAYSVKEVARRTGLSRAFLFKQIRAGALPSLLIGRRRLIRAEDEAAWLAAHRQGKAA